MKANDPFVIFFKVGPGEPFTNPNMTFIDTEDAIEYAKGFCKYPYKYTFVTTAVGRIFNIEVPDHKGGSVLLQDAFHEPMTFDKMEDAIHVAMKFENAIVF